MTTISYNASIVLQALAAGARYGFEIMRVTKLPSGTVYPLLRRLEASGYVGSRWEERDDAHSDRRPARRYYDVTDQGRTVLAEAREKIIARHATLFGDLPQRKGAES